MKFGVREICDVVFKAKSAIKIGTTEFKKGQPVLYIDSAKTSTIEGAATTVYATGGKGNTRLIAWEGEKTLTFTVEDALLSPIGFAVLSGAGLFKGKNTEDKVYVHTTANAYVDEDGNIDLTDALGNSETISKKSPIFVLATENDGSLLGMIGGCTVAKDGKSITVGADNVDYLGTSVFVDFYVEKLAANVSELQIDGANFAGSYYVEASTLFRRQSDGVDMPAEITFPNVKIQSNFTFNMASTGDPSTFTFTMDAFPGYTMFDKTKKVLCVIQVVEDASENLKDEHSVMKSPASFDVEEAEDDSTGNDTVENTPVLVSAFNGTIFETENFIDTDIQVVQEGNIVTVTGKATDINNDVVGFGNGSTKAFAVRVTIDGVTEDITMKLKGQKEKELNYTHLDGDNYIDLLLDATTKEYTLTVNPDGTDNEYVITIKNELTENL